MRTTLAAGGWPVCTAGPPSPLLEAQPGAYRLTPMPGPVNRTCQATTIAVAASRAVATTWRSRRVSVLAVLFMGATIAVFAPCVFDAGRNM
jgi:hypothetical protein